MYTIIINDNKTLTTSVKTTLLKGTTTDEIQFLYTPPAQPETDEDSVLNPQVTVEYVYMAILRYETDNVMKTESLLTDAELYKGRARFVLPRSAAFFRNRGVVQLWLEIQIDTITTTTTYDEETGEIIDEQTETVTDIFTTLPTTLFIEEVPHEGCHRDDDNTIRITRGDSLTVNISLTDNDGFPYIPVEGDQVLFTMKKSAKASEILLQKDIDIYTLEINFVEADTRNFAFGEYKYEIECITVANDHYTVIKDAPFIITEELH